MVAMTGCLVSPRYLIRSKPPNCFAMGMARRRNGKRRMVSHGGWIPSCRRPKPFCGLLLAASRLQRSPLTRPRPWQSCRLSDAGETVFLNAERLVASGVRAAEGFSVNVSHRQSIVDSWRRGLEVSDLLGDRDFVIDASRNGIGPPPDDPRGDSE